MNIWNLILFGLSKTPERALAILKSLEPSQWRLYDDGVLQAQPSYSFEVLPSAKNKMLIVDISYHDNNGNPQSLHIQTRCKNDQSDSLSINGNAQLECNFEFHSKPMKQEFHVELGYFVPDGTTRADGTPNGEHHVFELIND